MSRDGWKWMPPDQPRTCAGCGQRVKLNAGEPLWFTTSRPPQTWHVKCKPRKAA